MEAVAVILLALVVGAVGVWLGILLAPGIGRLAEPDDEPDEEPDDGR